MSRKRERLEVIFDILRTVQENNNSIRPTPLLRKSNLSSQSFSEYLDELLSKGFVKQIDDKKNKKYITLTDHGFKYIEKYRTLLGFINEFNL